MNFLFVYTFFGIYTKVNKTIGECHFMKFSIKLKKEEYPDTGIVRTQQGVEINSIEEMEEALVQHKYLIIVDVGRIRSDEVDTYRIV